EGNTMYELGIVNTTIHRPDATEVAALSQYGTATIHEAMGRVGLLRPYMRPIYGGATLCGPAVTVLLQPGDNRMLHVAAEQLQDGGGVAAGRTTASAAAFLGDLSAAPFRLRGGAAWVIAGGVRDTADLQPTDFPVFARAIPPRGTIKETLGSVN